MKKTKKKEKSHDSRIMRRVILALGDIYRTLREQRFFRIVGVTGTVLFIASVAIYLLEYRTGKSLGLWDSFWWALVTITTVGYGDIVPETVLGRLIGFTIMLSGLVLVSLMTATIASVFVTRKIKEDKGLEDVKEKDHIVLCGWNESGMAIIQGIARQCGSPAPVLALVNNLPREEVDSIIYRFPDLNFKYVRGNFTDEKILSRANISKARSAVIMADTAGGHPPDKADERTIFGCMAIKAMAPKVKTCAELLFAENREHLNRAGVDEVFVRGDHGAAILASAATTTGLSTVMKELMDIETANNFWRVEIPEKFMGDQIKSLAAFYMEKYSGLLLAIVSEKSAIALEDILSHDASAIDNFIKRKFEESGRDYFSSQTELSIQINPPQDYVLVKGDAAIILSQERPTEASFLEKSLDFVSGTRGMKTS